MGLSGGRKGNLDFFLDMESVVVLLLVALSVFCAHDVLVKGWLANLVATPFTIQRKIICSQKKLSSDNNCFFSSSSLSAKP